jgi:hypothetical protein
MNLSQISMVLGGLHVLFGLMLWLRPEPTSGWLRQFPRQVAPGVVLMLIGTAWFVSNLYRSNVQDFAEWRPILYAGFTLLGVGCCFFVQDYLSIRGGAVVALLGCDAILDIQRWHGSGWKNVIAIWCYVVIVLSVWWVGSPWRARDLTVWMTSEPGIRSRVGMGIAAFGGLLMGLGVSVLKLVK